MSNVQTQLLTPKEVGEMLGFQPRTIARWCREGLLDAQKIGRVWRINRRSVNRILASQRRYIGS